MVFDTRESMKLANQLCFPLYAAARNVTSMYNAYLKPELYAVQSSAFEPECHQHVQRLPKTPGTYLYAVYRFSGFMGEGRHLRHRNRQKADAGQRYALPSPEKMEQAGYIKRSRKPDDERVVMVTLTQEGREMQDQMLHFPGKVACCIKLSEDKAKTLYPLLYELLHTKKKQDTARKEDQTR